MKDGLYGWRFEGKDYVVQIRNDMVASLDGQRQFPVGDVFGNFAGPIDFEALPKVDTAGGE